MLHRLMRRLAATRPMAALLARLLAPADLWLARRSAGRWTLAELLVGLPIVELTTTGAHSGLPRTLPLVGLPDGDRLAIFGSSWGRQRPPAWHYNLLAHPEATVARRGRRWPVRARLTTGPEREAYWAKAVSLYPGYGNYQRRAGREIPVWVLEPLAPLGPPAGPTAR